MLQLYNSIFVRLKIWCSKCCQLRLSPLLNHSVCLGAGHVVDCHCARLVLRPVYVCDNCARLVLRPVYVCDK